ncbi:MAG: phosphatidylserine decarboxylase [Dehalococcoidia bacterium]
MLLPLVAAGAAAARLAPVLAPVPLVLGAGIALFFRDPERAVTPRPDAALSPADGRVLRVSVEPDEYWQQDMTEVAIFLGLQDVHVQRIPLAGQVVAQRRKAGGYKPAMTEAATHGNNQLATYLRTEVGPCTVTQISGLVARRIVTWAGVGDQVAQGDRLGMIKFGSQVTLRLPTSARVRVAAGDRVTGGITVIAEF